MQLLSVSLSLTMARLILTQTPLIGLDSVSEKWEI